MMNEQTTIIRKIERNHLQTIGFLTSIIIISVLVLSKDYFHSIIKGYTFYAIESLLFGLFWILFIPTVWMLILYRTSKSKLNGLACLLMMVLGHVVLFAALVHVLSLSFLSHTFQFVHIIPEICSEQIISVLFIYGLVIFIQNSVLDKEEHNESESSPLRAKLGAKTFKIHQEDIRYLSSERPYTALYTLNGKFLISTPLTKLLDGQLDKNFIRVHKSCIVNTRYIRSFESRKNGDYDVVLDNDESLRVSRNYNHYFRSH